MNSYETSTNALDTTKISFIFIEKSRIDCSGESVLLRNFKCLIPLVAFITFASIPASAKIIHVPADSSTIQSGINGASDGDTVLVARGHYYERINFYGKAILVTSNFIFDNDTTTIDSTIIDADTSVLGVVDTGSVVVFVSGEDSSSVISGFTVQNGIGTPYQDTDRSGGGIYSHSSSPVIKHNVVTGNYGFVGGGISCHYSSSIISYNVITENSADKTGGGISCHESTPIISYNTIIENSADKYGGGICCWLNSWPIIMKNNVEHNSASDGGGISCLWFSSAFIVNNEVSHNYAKDGGAIWCNTSSPTITNNTIIQNSAETGGGISCSYYSSPTVSSNTINRNLANYYGGGIYCTHSSPLINNNIVSNSQSGHGIYCESETNPIVCHNDFWNNAWGTSYDCPAGTGDTSWGTNINGTPCDSFHNIVRDPLFVDTLSDFHLQEGSPCIDAGDNSVAPDSDLDGNPRIVDGNGDDSAVVDMGALEYQPPDAVEDEDMPLLASDFVLSQNYPNPFNLETNIQYYIPEPIRVNLSIYNVLGQKIKVLVNDFQTKGKKSITWDGKDNKGKTVSSGIYFYKLETKDYVQSEKMLLLK